MRRTTAASLITRGLRRLHSQERGAQGSVSAESAQRRTRTWSTLRRYLARHSIFLDALQESVRLSVTYLWVEGRSSCDPEVFTCPVASWQRRGWTCGPTRWRRSYWTPVVVAPRPALLPFAWLFLCPPRGQHMESRTFSPGFTQWSVTSWSGTRMRR